MNALRRHENCRRATPGVSIQQLGVFPSHPHPFPKPIAELLKGSGWVASRSTFLRLFCRRLDCEEGNSYFAVANHSQQDRSRCDAVWPESGRMWGSPEVKC